MNYIVAICNIDIVLHNIAITNNLSVYCVTLGITVHKIIKYRAYFMKGSTKKKKSTQELIWIPKLHVITIYFYRCTDMSINCSGCVFSTSGLCCLNTDFWALAEQGTQGKAVSRFRGKITSGINFFSGFCESVRCVCMHADVVGARSMNCFLFFLFDHPQLDRHFFLLILLCIENKWFLLIHSLSKDISMSIWITKQRQDLVCSNSPPVYRFVEKILGFFIIFIFSLYGTEIPNECWEEDILYGIVSRVWELQKIYPILSIYCSPMLPF